MSIIAIHGKAGHGKDTVGKIIQVLIAKNKNKLSLTETENYLKDTGMQINDREEYSNWKIKKFVTPIKQIASIMTDIPVDKMETQKDKEVVLGKEWYKVILENLSGQNKRGLSVKEYQDYILPTTYVYKESDIIKPTLRKLLQEIGDVMLQIHPDWLLNIMFKDYVSEPHHNSTTKWQGSKWIITDLRKPNEYSRIKKLGGKCIKVVKTGQESNDIHISERALDKVTDWDYVIEAEHGDIDSLIKQVKEMLIKFGIL